MGLFGNKDYKIRVELAQEMAHNANDANKEIGEIMGAFDEDHKQFENVTDTILDLSEKILHKLSEDEMKELTELTETVCELHKDYMTKFRMVMATSKNQNERTEKAVDKYSRIKGV